MKILDKRLTILKKNRDAIVYGYFNSKNGDRFEVITALLLGENEDITEDVIKLLTNGIELKLKEEGYSLDDLIPVNYFGEEDVNERLLGYK